jgi:hypothetical protein
MCSAVPAGNTTETPSWSRSRGATLRLGVGTTADMLIEFRKPELIAPGKVTVKDYDFDSPDKNLKMEQNTILKHGSKESRSVFHCLPSPGRPARQRIARGGAWKRRSL